MTPEDIKALSGEDLRTQAKVLEIKFAANAGDRTIQDRMIESLGLSSDETGEQKNKTVNVAKKSEDVKSEMVTIVIATKEDDDQPVPVGLNGKVYRMIRGEKVTVPAGVVDILNNAKQMIRDRKTGEDREILAYSFQTVSG
jgi:hypothetical protein